MLVAYTTRAQNTPTQRPLLEPNALEFDEHGKMVPATLPHIYRWAFRHQNALEEVSDQVLSTRTSGSFRQNLRFELGITQADFVVFQSAARRYGMKEKEIKARSAAVAKADRAQHSNNPALSLKARTAVQALLAEEEEALNSELAAMKAALSPGSVTALDRRVVHDYAKTFLPAQEKTGEPAAPAPKPQPDVTPRGPATAAGEAWQSWHETRGRVKIKLPTWPGPEMTLAQANKIPLDLHGFAVTRIVVEWRFYELLREGQAGGVSEEVPLQQESDGSTYVNFVPVRVGKLNFGILVDFADGGFDEDRLQVNVDRLPDQPPDRLILSLGTDSTRRAGTLAFDLSPQSNRRLLTPVAFYKGISSPIPLIPAPSPIQSRLSYTIIPRKNQASPIVFDPNTGEVKAERLGQALLKVTLDNHAAYACMDVMQDVRKSIQRSNCSDFLPPDLAEPIDKSTYFEKRAAPPAAGEAQQNLHITEGRVKIKLPTTEMAVAQANRVPLDLHGSTVTQISVEWRFPEVARDGQYSWVSSEEALQQESDGSAYVNFVPVRMGKLELRILVYFADGGIDDDNLEVNIDRLPDQSPERLILSFAPGFIRRVGTLGFDLSPQANRKLLTPVAFYKGVDSPIPLIPAPSPIQSRLSYTIIPRKNQPSPIVFDPNTGEVKAERLGQALLKVTLDNHAGYACIDVMQDVRKSSQRSNCSDFLPPDLAEPIDKSTYPI
jgi:hypothetical protein